MVDGKKLHSTLESPEALRDLCWYLWLKLGENGSRFKLQWNPSIVDTLGTW